MTAAESLGCLRLAGLILIATTCVRARSSGYREHHRFSNRARCRSSNPAARASTSVRRCTSRARRFLRVQGLVPPKRQAVAASSPAVTDNGEESRTDSHDTTQRPSAVCACELQHCLGHASGQRTCHDQLLGCMGKFSCAVTMPGDAFQEQSGQSRERLRLSGTRLATAELHSVV